MKIIPVLSLFLACSLVASAQQPVKSVISGTVLDSATREPISGASIRIEGTTSGTYTRSGGRFRLPIPANARLLRVRSVGYHERMIAVEPGQEVMTIALPVSGVALTGVKVVGDITPEEIVRRSIERKKENAQRITSIVSTLYSKMKYNIDMGGLGAGGNGPKESITETFSKIYDRRRPDPKKRVHITQRRQTANVSAQSNLAVFDDFFDFTEDELTILKTTMITPLGKDALDEYEYQLLGKKPLGNIMVYELAFEPKARVFPGFEGTLTIVEGTYQVIAAKFSPTDETAFPFLKDLTYEQRYEKVNDSIWAPSFQNVTASAKIRIIAGLIELSADVAAQTYVTDIAVNVPIDDSLLNAPVLVKAASEANSGGATVRVERQNSTVTVDPGADSLRPEFWNEHSFSEQSEEDSLLYRRQDSVITAGGGREKDSARRANAARESASGGGGSLLNLPQIGNLSIGLNPLLNRSSITGMLYGGTIKAALSPLTLTSSAAFGERGTMVGSVELGLSVIENDSLELKLFGGIMSALATVQESRTIVKRLDFLHLSNLLFTDNFDFFRRDGFAVGATLRTKDVKIAFTGSWTRHINMPLIETVNRVTI
ncbi:MAG: carboxypeptidase-like regulatory domain-containing protein, partial [Candidatus Kapabacteria bacterium]|nr:carboxypeptidase-like regulatory domain-containing protein [Candidatus Kapabacteria bacterium]